MRRRLLAPTLSLVAVLLAALVGALTSLSGAAAVAARAGDDPRGGGRPDEVTLLQMNLCLSGLAGCYPRTAYPAVVDEAVARVHEVDADAVVLNEACSGDAERIAAETGLHLAFSTVIYRGAPLPCRNPEGRGVFGNAVLTAEEPFAVRDEAYAAQAGVEERRLLCSVTAGLTVCGTHLSTRGGAAAQAANDGQCAEMSEVLAAAARVQPTVGAGDVNRQDSCAPAGWWTVTDAAATQAPGIQHAYGDRRLRKVTSEVVPMTRTDHDALVVRFRVHG